jgi:catechol 2,3-dioxygenase-like lactoylglutathione lyase family enzyme
MERWCIDHVGIRVSDLEASRALYAAALAPLGFAQGALADDVGARGYPFVRDGRDDLWITEPIDEPGRDTVTTRVHIAFDATSSEQVDAFHRAALAHGATDIGAPGPRAAYGPGYYGAFVLDLGGNNIEAVWHDDSARDA